MTIVKKSIDRRLITGAIICLLAAGAVIVSARTHPAPARAFFARLFGRSPGGILFSNPEPQRPVDASRAPPPRKSETPPASTILIMGDSMADWLAYGLEEALGDAPEIGIVRKSRIGSGLI